MHGGSAVWKCDPLHQKGYVSFDVRRSASCGRLDSTARGSLVVMRWVGWRGFSDVFMFRAHTGREWFTGRRVLVSMNKSEGRMIGKCEYEDNAQKMRVSSLCLCSPSKALHL